MRVNMITTWVIYRINVGLTFAFLEIQAKKHADKTNNQAAPAVPGNWKNY